jgi:hypothetical protein
MVAERSRMPTNIGGIEMERIIQVAVAVGGTYVFLFWFGLVYWAFRDIRARSQEALVQVLAVLLVLFFNLPGLLLYNIFRPRETLAEVYERALREETLLQELEDPKECPVCKKRVEKDFLVCPSCRTQLKRLCSYCKRTLHPKWSVCPYCAASVGEGSLSAPEAVS